MSDAIERITRLEDTIAEIRGALARIESRLEQATTKADLADLRGDLTARIAAVDGRTQAMPTTWQMITAIVAGQVALASLLASIIFGVARAMGRM